MYGVKMRGDFLRFQAQYLRRICIPRIESLKKRAVNRLLSVDASIDQDDIDDAVADVYGLTDREMLLVRSVAARRRQC
jgi:hypothetical protein